MSLGELLRLSLSRLRTSRLRAALTMLGVIIGVASVVALVGVGQGTTSNITSRLAGLGTNLLTVSPNGGGSTSSLTLGDAEAIGKLASIGGVAPEISTSLTVRAGTTSSTTTVIGTTPAYPDGPGLRGLAGHLPDRRQHGQRPAGGGPRRHDRHRPRARGGRPRLGDLGRRAAVPRRSASCRPRAGRASPTRTTRSSSRSGSSRSISSAVTASARSACRSPTRPR